MSGSVSGTWVAGIRYKHPTATQRISSEQISEPLEIGCDDEVSTQCLMSCYRHAGLLTLGDAFPGPEQAIMVAPKL